MDANHSSAIYWYILDAGADTRLRLPDLEEVDDSHRDLSGPGLIGLQH